MSKRRRIIAFDVGATITGVAVADVGDPTEALDVIKLGVLQTSVKDKPDAFMATLTSSGFHELIRPGDLVLLENMPGPNWTVIRRNKAVRQYFEGKGAHVQCLMPNQKYGVKSKKSSARKQEAVATATDILKGTTAYGEFTSFARNHDIADALLMVEYLHRNPHKVKKSAA